MKFVWVPSISRFRRTETEVKKEKLKYEVVEFETDKDSLIDRFNAYEERIEALQAQINGGALPSPSSATIVEESETAAEPAPPAPPPASEALGHSQGSSTERYAHKSLPDEAEMKRRLAQQLRGMEREAIEDAILESKGPAFGAYLSCAISRLGELGREGWSQFAAFRHFTRDAERSQDKAKFKHISTYDERGLRYLALMQVKDLDNGEPLE